MSAQHSIDVASLPAYGLGRETYISDEVFAQEQARIFDPRWQFAGHVSQLPQVGSFFRFERGGQSIVVVRSAEDEIVALHNVCRHRGARVVEPESGVCRMAFVCQYHGWSYNRDGTLRGAPRMQEGFDKDDFPLKRAWVDVWEGLVFVAFTHDRPKPVADQLSTVDFSAHGIANTKIAFDLRREVAANWKILWENGVECYHCAINHPELKQIAQTVRDGPAPSHIADGEYDFRPEWQLLDGVEAVTLSGRYECAKRLGPEGGPVPSRVAFLQWHTTLVEFMAGPDHGHVMTYTPIAPDRTEVRVIGLVHADAVEGVDYNPEELQELHRITRGQDDDLAELVQKGVQSPAFEPGPYNDSYEFINKNFVRLYLELMG